MFQFKQFAIQQEHAALKVCTDSCLFAALAPCETAAHILDIGTGTGLLALMLAQKCSAEIDAVEIDAGAVKDATTNFENAPWQQRLYLFHLPIQEYVKHCTKTYDFIIANPPFYAAQLLSPEASRNAALHSTQLSFQDLLMAIQALLSDTGHFFVLLPPIEAKIFASKALELGFGMQEAIRVKNNANGKVIRKIMLFAKTASSPEEEREIVIRDEKGSYSEAFVALLKPYYLYL